MMEDRVRYLQLIVIIYDSCYYLIFYRSNGYTELSCLSDLLTVFLSTFDGLELSKSMI